jgi:hypothetical protein
MLCTSIKGNQHRCGQTNCTVRASLQNFKDWMWKPGPLVRMHVRLSADPNKVRGRVNINWVFCVNISVMTASLLWYVNRLRFQISCVRFSFRIVQWHLFMSHIIYWPIYHTSQISIYFILITYQKNVKSVADLIERYMLCHVPYFCS